MSSVGISKRLAIAWSAITLAVAGYLVVTVLLAWPFAVQEVIREHSPLAWLSSMLLTGACLLGVVIALSSRRAVAFGLVAAGLFYLALDERLMLHESMKAFALEHFFGGRRAAMGGFGDLPLVVVVAIGGVALYRLRGEFPEVALRGLLAAAVVVGAAAVALDVATLAPAGQLGEELLEIAAETLFLLALLGRAERAAQGSGFSTR